MGVAYHAWLAEMEYQANAPTASWYYWLGDYVMAGQVRRRFRETCWPWLLDGGCVGGFGDSLPRHGGADDEAAKGVEHQVSADAPMTIRNTDQRVDREKYGENFEGIEFKQLDPCPICGWSMLPAIVCVCGKCGKTIAISDPVCGLCQTEPIAVGKLASCCECRSANRAVKNAEVEDE